MARRSPLRVRRSRLRQAQRPIFLESLESRLLLASDTTDVSGLIDSDQSYSDDVEVTGDVTIQGDVTLDANGNTFTLDAEVAIMGDGQGDRDNLTIQAGTVYIYGQIGGGGMQNITIEADEIYILDDAVLTTRQIADESSIENFGNDDSTSDSGDLSLSSTSHQLFGDQLIQIQNDSGTTGPRFWTQASGDFEPGDISIDADDTAEFFQSVPWGVSNKDAQITIQDAQFQAGSIEVAANAADNNLLDDLENLYSGGIANVLEEDVGQALTYILNALTVPISVEWRSSTAGVTVEDSLLIAADDITLSSTSITDATVEAISVVTQTAGNVFKALSGSDSANADCSGEEQSTTRKLACGALSAQSFLTHFAAALSRGVSDAQTQINGDSVIQSTSGSVTISSNATNTGSATAEVFGNANSKTVPADKRQWDVGITVTVTNTTAHTVVSEGSEIFSAGDATISSSGTIKSKVSSKARVYLDGSTSLGFGLNVDNTNVSTTVDGSVTAGATVVDSFIDIDLITDNNEITLDNHGFATGDEVIYDAGGGDPIAGLTDGDAYYVRVTGPDTFQLTLQDSAIDIDNANVNSGVTHSLSPQDAYVINSATDIDPDSNEFIVADHGFTTGEQISYTADPEGEEFDGMTSGADYYVVVTSPDTFQLASNLNRAVDEAADIDLVESDLDAGSSQLFGYVDLGQGTTMFDAASADVVDLDDSQFTIADHGFFTAQILNYATDGGDAIGALTDRGFFAIVTGDDTFQLADTWDDAVLGVARDFGDVEGVPGSTLVRDVTSNLVYQYIGPSDLAYDLSSIDYASDAASDDPVWELTEVDGDSFVPDPAADMWDSDFTPTLGTGTQDFTYKTRTNQFDPSDNSLVYSDDNTIVIPNHGFAAGDGVYYQTAPTYSEQATVTGQHVFDPASDTFVDLDRDSITFQPGPLLVSGQQVAYWVDFDGQSGTPVGGLVPVETDSDQRYYVIPVELVDVVTDVTLVKDVLNDVVYEYVGADDASLELSSIDYADDPDWNERDDIDPDTFTQDPDADQYDSDYTVTTVQLAASADDAAAGIAIDLTSFGEGTYQTLLSLQQVTEHDTPISGLSNETYYNVVVIDENTIQLAETLLDAVAATPIQLDGSTATGDRQAVLESAGTSGLTISSTLTATDTVKASGKTGSNPRLRDLYSTPAALLPLTSAIRNPADTKKLMEGGLGNQGFKKIEGENFLLSLGTGVGINVYNHSSLAAVTESARLKSTGDLAVSSALDQTYSVNVESGTGKADKGVAISAAVNVGVYTNDSQALVYDGAEVDAAGTLSVTSSLTYENNLITVWNGVTEETGEDKAETITTAIVDSLKDLMDGALGIDDLVNTWTQTKNKGKKYTQKDQDEGKGTKGEFPNNSYAFATVFAYQQFENDSQAVVGYRQDGDDAIVGAKINQDAGLQSDTQAVLVQAETDFTQASLAGIISMELTAEGAIKAVKSKDAGEFFNVFGNRAGTGVGASAIVQVLNNDTSALVEEGVALRTGVNGDSGASVNGRQKALAVLAFETLTSVELAEGGTDAASFGLTGAGTVAIQTSNTTAQIATDVDISGGGVGVKATNDELRVSVAGSLVQTQATGVGVGLVWNEINRTTQAVIGNGDLSSPGEGELNIDVENSIDLYSENTGGVYGFGISGEFAGDKPANQDENADGTDLALQFSGNVAVALQTDVTQSFINGAGSVDASDVVELDAESTTTIVTAAGGFSLDKSSSKLQTKHTGVGFFGSVALHEATLTTQAMILNADVTAGSDVVATADQDGFSLAVTLTVSVAYTSAAQDSDSVEIAGTASVITADVTTEAYVQNAAINTVDDTEFTATDTFYALGIAGSLDFDSARKAASADADDIGSAGSTTQSGSTGLSLAFNEITSTVRAYSEDAVIAAASATFTALASAMSLDSVTSRQILAITVAGGLSANTSKGKSTSLVASGAGSGNNVESTIVAYADGGTITTDGDATFEAREGSNILAISIGVGIDTSNLTEAQFADSNVIAIDAAAADNSITNTVAAYVSAATVDVGGDFSATATSDPEIQAYSFGISLSGASTTSGTGVSVSGGGAGAGNTINRDMNANASDSTLIAGGDVSVSSTDSAIIEAVIVSGAVSFAGGGSGAGGEGVGISLGASVAANHLGWQAASEDDADFTYTSDDEPDELETGDTVLMTNGPLAGAVFEYVGSDTLDSPDLSLQNYNDPTIWEQIGSDVAVGISAYISDSSVVAGDLSVSVTSAPALTASVWAGAVGVSKSTDGVAVDVSFVVAKNNVNDEVQAYIRGDQSTPSIQANSMLVTADDDANTKAVTGAISVAVTVADGTDVTVPIGLSVAINEIDNDLGAFVDGANVVTATGDVTVTAGTGGDDPFVLDLASEGVTADELDDAAEWFSEDSNTTSAEAQATLQAVFEAINDALVDEGQPPLSQQNVFVAPTYSTDDGVVDELQNGQSVVIADSSLGTVGNVYVYLGDDEFDVDLTQQDYSDTEAWELQQGLYLSTIQDGESWKLITGDGSTYTITLDDSGTATASLADVSAVSIAASVGVGVTSEGGPDVTVSGAGALSMNSILSQTEAYISDSTVDSPGAVSVTSAGDDAITATVVAASISVAASGANTGVGVSLGVAVGLNYIGYDVHGNPPADAADDTHVHAYIAGSDVTAEGSVYVSAQGTESIDTGVISGSVAVVAGAKVGMAASGSGVVVLNEISTETAAYFENSEDGNTSDQPTNVNAGNVTVDAVDASTITAFAATMSVVVQAGGGDAGVDISLGAALAFNSIDNRTLAYMLGGVQSDGAPNHDAPINVTTTAGDITITANEDATIGAYAWAAAVTVGVDASGVAVTVDGGGAAAKNTINNTTNAYATNTVLIAAGDVNVVAEETSTINAVIITAAVSVSVSGAVTVAPVVGISVAINNLGVDEDPSADYLLSSSSFPSQVNPSETLAVEEGVLSGAVYEYIGVTPLSVTSRDDIDLLDVDQWTQIYAPATAGIEASIQDSDVTAGGDLTISATNDLTITATIVAASVGVAVSTGGVAVGVTGAVAVTKNTIEKIVAAFIDNTQVPDATITAADNVVVEANDFTNVTADTEAATLSVVYGTGVGVSVSVGVAAASSDIDNDVSAYVQSAAANAEAISVSANGSPTIDSSAVAISLSVGASDHLLGSWSFSGGGGSSNVTLSGGTVDADVDDSTVNASGDVDVQANFEPNIESSMVAVSISVGVVAVAAAGAVTHVDVDPSVSASISGGEVVADDVSITANDQRNLLSSAEGVAVSVGALGISNATLTSSGDLSAQLGDNAVIQANSLSISANRNQDTDQLTTLAESTAGTGGLLVGVSAATATVVVEGTVSASTGDNVTLPDGDVTISAVSNTAPSANATGDTVAGLALGAIFSETSTDVDTSATFGAGVVASDSRTGDVRITADAYDQNLSNAVAGQGGIISGDGASAQTSNDSQVTAELSGGSIHAGAVVVSAQNTSEYAPASNTVSASGLGVSGANSSNTNTTSATVSLGGDTQIVAAGTVSITSENDVSQTENPNAQDSQDGTSAYAGAGGVVDGSAAYNEADLDPTSSVMLGPSVQITSGTDPFDNPGGIVITAGGSLQVSDEVKLSTGGALAGGRAHSDLDATATNSVSIGSASALTTWGDVDIGAYNFISAETNALANAGGIVGAANTEATTDVSSQNTISVAGGGTMILAFGDVNLAAGEDPTGANSDSFTGSTTANSQSYGVAGIPTMNTETELDSTSTLTVADGVTIESGGNANLGAYGLPSGTFYQNGTWNDADVIDANQGDATVGVTNDVVVDGSVSAGVYHTLDVSIPDDQSAGDEFSQTLTITSSGPDALSLADYIRSRASFDERFDARDFVTDNFDEESASFLTGTLSDDPVGAYTLDDLYAEGGSVLVNWDDSDDDPNQGAGLSGAGTITANGGASITVTNESPDYLVLGEMTIPDDAEAGEILINGEPADGDDAYDAVVMDSVGAGQTPAIVVDQIYDGFVGDVASGPALLFIGTISNSGGVVSITNDLGSVGQTSTIYAEQINISAPNSVVTISTPGDYYVGTDPYSTWEDYMIWPGGNPADATTFPAETAVTYLANAIYNSNSAYDDANDFTRYLVGSWQDDSRDVDDNTQSTASQVFLSDVVAYDSPDSGGTDSLSNSLAISQAASTDLLVKTVAYQISRRADDGEQRGWFPEVAIRDLLQSASDYSLANLPVSSEPNLQASAVSITADTIGLNGTIQTSQPNDWSLLLSSDLTDELLDYQQQYDSGATSDPQYEFPLQTVNDGDVQINAVYDARSGRIIVNDVSNTTPSGTVILVGKIMSTNPNGKIDVQAPDGNVRIENETGIPLTVQKLETGGDGGSAQVSITDQNYDSSENQWLYVYEPGESVQVYRGAEGDAAEELTLQTNADASSYQPLESIRWQWTQQAMLHRQATGSGSSWRLSDWQWQEQDGVRWPYVDPTNGSTSADPVGEIVQHSLSEVFHQRISGTIDASHFIQAHYDKHDASNNSFDWWWEYITEGTLTMTMSVKADNPIAIEFSDAAAPVIEVSTNSSLLLTDDVSNPAGDVVFDVEHLSATRNASIEAKDLTITASEGVGASNEPVDVTFSGSELTAQAGPEGIFLKVNSDVTVVQVSAGNETDGYGDVVIHAAGDLAAGPTSDGAPHVVGKNITLRSRDGGVGSSDQSFLIQPHSIELINGAARDGVVDVDARGDVHLTQAAGDILVRQIRSQAGDVFLDVPSGSVYDADFVVSAAPTRAEAELVWARLGSMDADFGAQGVATFEGFVEFNYDQYWMLLDNGQVQNGTFTLDDGGVDLYAPQASAVLDDPEPSEQEVQDYANDLYQTFVDFFNENLTADWMNQADFQSENPDYQYTATDEQIAELTRHTQWTEGDLTDLIDLDALDASDASLAGATPKITGQTVTINAGNELGQFLPTLEIALEDIENETLTEEEQQMLALATARGEAVMVGADENGETVTYSDVEPPEGVTPTAVRLSIKRPALVSAQSAAPGALTIDAPGRVAIVNPSGDVILGAITSDGTVEITASGSILNPPVTETTEQTISGFGDNGDGWTVNSNNEIFSTPIASDVLTLTDGGSDQARSAWFSTPVSTDSFTASFTYQAGGSRSADGVAFVFQNEGLDALGANGGALGYTGISGDSAAYQINLWHNHQEGTNFNTNGVTGANGPDYLATGSVSLSGGNPIDVVLTYDEDAATLEESLTDTVTGATYSHTFSNVDLDAILGSSTMLIGFTGGTGGATSVQTISNFTWTDGDGTDPSEEQAAISAASVSLTAESGSIGSEDNPLWVVVGDGVLNASAQGDIYINQLSGTLTVGAVSSAAGDIVLDPPEPGQSLVLTETSIVSAPFGGVVLEARDDIELPAGSQIVARTVSLRSALRDAAAGAGSRFILAGLINADSIDLMGSAGEDSIMIGSDGSTPGSLDNLRGLLSVIGGGGEDELVLDDRGAQGTDGMPLRVGYAITGNQIGNNPGAGFGQRLFAGLTYDGSIKQLQLRGSAGAGVFHVKPSDVTDFILDGDAADQAGGEGNRLVLDPAGLEATLEELRGAGEFSFGEGRTLIEFSGMKQLEQVELGAVAEGPTLFASSPDGAAFTITYHSFTALDLSNLLGQFNAILVTGPHGYNERAEFVSVTPSDDGTAQIATYRAPSPDGAAWQRSRNGEYLIDVAPNQITDSQGNPLPPRQIGSFWVSIDAIRLSSTLTDVGRYRLEIDNAVPGGVVVFAYGTQPGTYEIASAGVTLNIADPVFLAQVVVPPNGQVAASFHVTAAIAGQEFSFQAFQQLPDPHSSQRVGAELSPPVSSTTMAPLVASIAPAGAPVTSTGTLDFVVTFRTAVSGVSASDFELAAGEGVVGARITGVRGSGAEYVVSVGDATGDGLLRLNLRDESAIADASGIDPLLTRNGAFEGEAFTLHNTRQDVNLDFAVTALDALVLINALNVASGSLPGSDVAAPPAWYDVNQDGMVTPLDVLRVINYLNLQAALPESEGASATALPLSVPITWSLPQHDFGSPGSFVGAFDLGASTYGAQASHSFPSDWDADLSSFEDVLDELVADQERHAARRLVALFCRREVPG